MEAQIDGYYLGLARHRRKGVIGRGDDKILKGCTWLFFAATMYLILVELLDPWVHLPGLGNIGFTLVLCSSRSATA